jgi:putative endonuclease
MLFRIADALRRRLQKNDVGRRGEDLAHRYLRKRKFVIVARNYRPVSGAPGEIDLVARCGLKLVFVEVKTRMSDAVSFPERAVDGAKQRALIRAGREYARRANVPWTEVRFDVVAITGLKKARIEHYEDAFDSNIPGQPAGLG